MYAGSFDFVVRFVHGTLPGKPPIFFQQDCVLNQKILSPVHLANTSILWSQICVCLPPTSTMVIPEELTVIIISDYREYSALTTWCSMCWTPKTGPWKQDPRFSALGNRQSCDVRSSWWSWRILTSRCSLPSGKHTKNFRKSPFWMWKLTISTGPFSIAMLAYQRVLCGKIEVWFIDDPRYPQVTVRAYFLPLPLGRREKKKSNTTRIKTPRWFRERAIWGRLRMRCVCHLKGLWHIWNG